VNKSREKSDQCRLPCTIESDHGMHLTRSHIEVDVLQSDHPWVSLGDPSHFHEGSPQGRRVEFIRRGIHSQNRSLLRYEFVRGDGAPDLVDGEHWGRQAVDSRLFVTIEHRNRCSDAYSAHGDRLDGEDGVQSS